MKKLCRRVKVLSLGVEDAEESDLKLQGLWIGCDFCKVWAVTVNDRR
jgi:hypothetical protein